jgi:hypothetical protein
MKSVKIEPNVNWHTVAPKYGPDDYLQLDNADVNTKDGVQFNLSYALKNVTDIKTNNYTQLLLTDNVRVDKTFTPNIKSTRFPEQFTTHLIVNSFPYYTGRSSFLKVLEYEGDENYRWHVIGAKSFSTDLSKPQYPKFVGTESHNSRAYKTDATDDNGIYYTVTLLDHDYLTIMHDDNYADVYLTSTGNPAFGTDELFFATAAESDDDDIKFRYVYNPESGFLSIYKNYLTDPAGDPSGVTKTYYLISDMTKYWDEYTQYNTGDYVYWINTVYRSIVDNNTGINPTDSNQAAWAVSTNTTPYNDYGVLGFVEAKSGNMPIPKASVMRTIPYTRNSIDNKISNTWVSYSIYGEQNNLNVNESKSYKNIYNNYMLSVPYKTITSETAEYNVLQLKNQLTPKYESSRGNPFPNYRECDHREYDKIFSGTNQIRGTDQLSFGYNSYVTTIDLEPDKITYFNTPQEMYPNKKININDSGLIEGGAIGGDTPIVSDKIFKKAADYKYNTPYGAPTEEESGVWLCSWLKTNIGTDWDSGATYKKDILVNYDNKTYKSREENSNAQPNLDKLIWKEIPGGQPVWVDRYYNPERYSAEEALKIQGQYYDYTSKFEYIVQKFNAENEYVFDKKSDLTFEPGSLYAYYRIGPNENQSIINTEKGKLVHEGIMPSYKQNREPHANIEDDLELDGTVFIETESLNKTTDSEFTISINIDTDDWSKPIGSQLIGNYSNQGLGIFNKIVTTPYITFTELSGVHIYNTDLEKILTLNPTGSSIKAVHAEGSENMHILCETNTNEYTIYQYDLKGMLVEKFLIPNTINSIVDFNIDKSCYYILDDQDNLKKYNINNEREDLLFNNIMWPRMVIGGASELSPSGENYTSSGKAYVEPAYENHYRINCDLYTIDLNGDTWFIKDSSTVYKNVKSSDTGVSASFRDILFGRSISLVSEETILGDTQGNQILLVGDGTSTLEQLINRWNSEHPGNRVTSLSDSGLELVIPDEYEIQLVGGIDRGADLQMWALSGSSDHTISSIKTDCDNNIWLISNQGIGTSIYKLDSDRNILLSKKIEDIDTSITPGLTGTSNLDIISEFNESGYECYVMVLMHETGSDQVTSIKLSLDGTHKSTQVKTIPMVAYKGVDNFSNITNFSTVMRMFPETVTGNYITFKIRYSSYFDPDKTYVEYLQFDAAQLTKGSHHFAAGFNAINGNLALFVDGELQVAKTSDDVFTGAAYRFSKTIHTPLYVGCDSFFNNVVLSEYLKQNNHYFASNCKVSDIRVYNKYLNFHKIRALTRENKQVQSIHLTLPTGKRSYLDQTKQYYHNKMPGRKSNYFDINIVSNTITAVDVRDVLEEKVKEDIDSSLPANVYINNINWIS